MDLLSVFLLSVTEGLTEFLPISSTGHMIIVADFLNLEQTEILTAFKVMIQLGAILAIVFLYKEKISFKQIDLFKKIFLAFLPAAIIGFIFSDHIKMLFSVEVVAIAFIVGGVALLFAEKIYKKNKRVEINNLEKINTKQSLIIGFFQILSLIPGTSRAAATIFGAMTLGINRKISAEFSFLLALPIMIAVFLYQLVDIINHFNVENILFFSIGLILSFLTAYFSIKLFLKFLEKFTLFAFGVYRIVFGLILLLFFI